MPISIPNAYIETYESNVRHLAQQKRSKLRDCVTEVNRQSKTHNWDRLAASTARLKDSVRKVSPAGGSGSGAVDTTDGLEWTRRATLIQTWDWGEIIASEEALQMLIDPYSSVTENGAMAMKRAVDDIIISKAAALASDGHGGTSAFPPAQLVGDGTAQMSMDMLLTVRRKFAENDVELDEPLFLVISPAQQEALLKEEKVTSFDYQNQKMLADGYVENFLGFSKVIVSTRLADGVVPSTSVACYAMTRKALGLHVAGEIRAQAAPRPDMSFETQVYLQLDMDCVRVEDEHIVKIDVLR